MSVKVMTAVFDRYPNGGGEMVLALALADHADDQGGSIFPSVRLLSEKTRQSTRTVQYQLRKMEQIGWLQLVANESGGRGRAREYQINPDWIKGADIAPLSIEEKGADSAPIEEQKDAEVAPFNGEERAQDLHPYKPERVQSTTERVQSTTQKGATAIAPEPSVTVKEPSVKYKSFDFSRWPAMPDQEVLDDWFRFRKRLKAEVTQTAINRMAGKLVECLSAGYSVNLCLSEAVLRGWRGLELEWLQNGKVKPDTRQQGGGGRPVSREQTILTDLQETHAEIQTLKRLKQSVPDALASRHAALRQQLHELRGDNR